MATSSVQVLKSHGLRVTPVREQVIGLFLKSGALALSNTDIEKELQPLDRITLYRTLRSFQEKGLIHSIVTQKGVTKYAICKHDSVEHGNHDDHVHFHCVACDTTICLTETKLPTIDVPVGFQAVDKQVIVSGRCGDCQE